MKGSWDCYCHGHLEWIGTYFAQTSEYEKTVWMTSFRDLQMFERNPQSKEQSKERIASREFTPNENKDTSFNR